MDLYIWVMPLRYRKSSLLRESSERSPVVVLCLADRCQTYAGEASARTYWLPLHRHAHQGISLFGCIKTSLMMYQAAADKLIREMERFGQDFEGYSEEEPTS